MPWIELVLDVPEEATEEVTTRLALRGLAFEVRDAETLARPGPGLVQLRIYVAPERADAERATVARLVQEAAALVPAAARARLTAAELLDESWRDAWKRFFRAQRLGRRFLLRPSWDQVAAGPEDRVIDLDPGRAFGTGAHASTRLCLEAIELLEERGLRPGRFLDAGCGSGILSIGALRVWPTAHGVCCDVDPEAVETARENAALNHALDSLDFVGGDAEAAGTGFDLVLANIQLEVLERIAAPLAAAVAPGGALVLSGLLEGQDEPAGRAYTAHGLRVTDVLDAPEWRAVVLVRRGASPSAPQPPRTP
jgi:ribosomal protein L11 methyltransferase